MNAVGKFLINFVLAGLGIAAFIGLLIITAPVLFALISFALSVLGIFIALAFILFVVGLIVYAFGNNDV